MKLMNLVGSLLCLLIMCPIVSAQSASVSGAIRGTIIDPSGAVLPRVTVTAVDPQTGLHRTAVSDANGQFRLIGLSPAVYEVTAELPGFSTETRKSLAVAIGQNVVSDFQLRVSAVPVVVDVTDQPPVVETDRGSQANSVPERFIADLPIDRRDYLTFALLMPGVSNSNTIAGNADFRVKQTPQSGLSFYGSNGRGNSVTVDGGEANDDAGGVRLTLSQDAVQEFQINRSNYSAELGGASGAAINIISKSGTNEPHGSLYGYFRNDAMDAADPFAKSQALQPGGPFSLTAQGQPLKNSLQRYQDGGTLGFPIKKDKTFLFAAFEGLLQNSQSAVPLLTNSSIFAGPNPLAASNPFQPSDPRSAQQSVVTALATAPGNPIVPCFGNPSSPPIVVLHAQTCAGALQSALTVSPVTGLQPINTAINNYLINQLQTNGGLFQYNTRQYLASARLVRLGSVQRP